MSADTQSPNATNYNFQIPSEPSRYLRGFLAYKNALEIWDHEGIMACFDDSLVHRILPASLGRPARSKEEYSAFWKDVPKLFGGNKFELTLYEVVESGNTLVVHCASKCLSAGGIPYTNEYSLFIHFVPLPAGVDPYSPLVEGDELPKMKLVKEFVDSAFSSKFFEAVGATALLNNAKET